MPSCPPPSDGNPDPGSSGTGGVGNSSADLLSLGIGLSSGAIFLPAEDGAFVESTTGNVSGTTSPAFTISGTSGTLSAIVITASGVGINCLVTVDGDDWLLSYSGSPLDPDAPLSEVHGLISGKMATAGPTTLTNDAGAIVGEASSSLLVFDNVTIDEAEAYLADYEHAGIASYGAVSMAGRLSWNWGDFWIGCGAGAVTGGAGGAVVGGAVGVVGAPFGAGVGAVVGCVTGGLAAGGAGNVIPYANPDEPHILESICIGGVVGGICGTGVVYLWPKPPTTTSLGSDPHTQYVIRQYMAKLGAFD